MKKNRVTYLALATLLSTASCSNEAVEPAVVDWIDGNIYLKPSLAGIITSRGSDMTLDDLKSFQVTCFNTGDLKKDATGPFQTYFENATFVRRESSTGLTFESSPFEEPRKWPDNNGTVKFYAFSPSIDAMRAANPDITDDKDKYYNFDNSSTVSNSVVTYGYSLGAIRVNSDIADQFDFVTAEATGERWKDFSEGVDLAFHHQMSQVELRAWGNGISYDLEIAGICLGNPVVEGTFMFSDPESASAQPGWKITDHPTTDKVQYLYRGPDSDITADGDKIFIINSTQHNSPETAQSIMGLGGCAIVIPTVNPKWEGLADPDIADIPYSTRRMYFSILMRVTFSSNGDQIYPYPDHRDGMTVIHYAVDEEGTILARLYPGVNNGEFFTDTTLLHPYILPAGTQIKQFGWAAVPIDVDWSAGKRYIYTLDYSEGVGIHDPRDIDPGHPIISGNVPFNLQITPWNPAGNSDILVPRK